MLRCERLCGAFGVCVTCWKETRKHGARCKMQDEDVSLGERESVFHQETLFSVE